MRVLFPGGTSLTGPYAVRRLHALGHEVRVCHRGDHDERNSRRTCGTYVAIGRIRRELVYREVVADRVRQVVELCEE